MDYIVLMEVLKAKNDLAHVKLGIVLSKHAMLVKIVLQVTSCQYILSISTAKHSNQLVIPLIRSNTW